MADPLNLTVLTGVALTEGIKFLYQQAGSILKRRAEYRQAPLTGRRSPTVAIAVTTPAVVAGRLAPIQVDEAAADALAEELKRLRHRVEDVAQGFETPGDDDSELLAAVGALRDAIEDVIGQRTTFRGEQRDPAGMPVSRAGSPCAMSGAARRPSWSTT